jgi:hypothetical protein
VLLVSDRKLTYSAIAAIPLVMLSAATVLLHGPLSNALAGRNGERRSPLAFPVVVIAAALGVIGILSMWATVSHERSCRWIELKSVVLDS